MNFQNKIKIKTTVKPRLAELFTPIGIYLRLRDNFRDTILLESAGNQNSENAFSFIYVNAIAGMGIRNFTEAEFKFPIESPVKINLRNEKWSDLLQEFSNCFNCEKSSHEHEKTSHSFYAGCIGFAGFDGSCNQALMIRTFLVKTTHFFTKPVPELPQNPMRKMNYKK
jgi:anthranilate synthase component 1